MRSATSSGCSMRFDMDSITPGISTLPSGNFTFSNTFHSCACRPLAASNERPCGRAVQNQLDDLLERHVAMVRARVVAPAQVHAHAIRGNVRGRGVQHFDVLPRVLPEFLDRPVGEFSMTRHRQVGAVELQQEAGLDDRLVLRLHGLRHGP